MKFTILHANDRIASIFKQAKSVVKQLPLDEMQQHWDKFVKNVTDKMNDTLQDQIEMLTLQLKDNEEKLTTLQALNDNLHLRYEEVKAKLEAEWATHSNYAAIAEKSNQLEAEIVKLKEELKVQCLNRDHFRALVAQQDAFIQEIKTQVETYKKSKQQELNEAVALVKVDLDAKTKETNHLAKQALRLNEENATLIEENTQFKEQTTRLVEEKRKLTDQVNNYECRGVKTGEMGEYCGGCLGCIQMQTDHALHETSNALDKAQLELKTYKHISDLQAGALGSLYVWVKKYSEKIFPPKGISHTLQTYDAICEQVCRELGNLTPKLTENPTVPNLETCSCQPALAEDINKVAPFQAEGSRR